MECFTKCGWRGPAVSEARTDRKDSLKVLRGKAVEDPALKTFEIGAISSQPSGANPSESSFPTFETESLPFAQEFYGVIYSSYGRLVSPFPYEPRPDPVRASVMVRVLLRGLSKLIQFEGQSC